MKPRLVLLFVVTVVAAQLFRCPRAAGQTKVDTTEAGAYVEKFVRIGGDSLRYLDFGGAGLPVVFTPAMVRHVDGYARLGSLLRGDYRVLAIGRRDADTTITNLGIADNAADLLHFLDALGMDRAVFAGNTEPAYRLTYLAEQHPERLAGLIYLAGPPSAAATFFRNPASGWPMLVRWWGVGDDFLDADPYAFRYLSDTAAVISVPALTFVNERGTRGVEGWITPLMEIGSPRVAEDIEELASSSHPGGDYYMNLLTDDSLRTEHLAAIDD